MLVLGRKVGETIFINGGEIKVTVLSIKGAKVRLGFKADAGIPIARQEVFEADQLEKRELSGE